jgi:hypothetical protein
MVLLDMLKIPLLVEILAAFYGNGKFSVMSKQPNTFLETDKFDVLSAYFLRPILILSLHLRQGLPRCLFVKREELNMIPGIEASTRSFKLQAY